MAKQKKVVAARLFDLATVIGRRHLIQLTVDAQCNPVILSLKQVPDYRVETDHGSFAKKRADRQNAFRIHHHVNDHWKVAEASVLSVAIIGLDLHETLFQGSDATPRLRVADQPRLPP